ncbi:hypothetical protein DYQ86_20395 [Acidobacteria bacterium AB60]|nr:hypothetical protein DYQ86_20395 [Acidobacteria bacterium AB60]
MAAAHVLHVGDPSAHRAQVLRVAGYEVDECETLPSLAAWFLQGRDTDLVCISEELDRAAEGVLALTRNYSSAPIVLFRAGNGTYLQRGWDLEVPPFTPPERWLDDLAQLLALTRANIAASQALQQQSRQLREEAQRARAASEQLRATIRSQREK